MFLEGEAFIALWNGRSADRSDYDVWHTREHVPERLTVEGMIEAARYEDGRGPLPSYFTFYSLRDLAVLEQSDYTSLQRNPSSWTMSMRPDFSRFLRLPCRLAKSIGAGFGGACLTGMAETPISDMQLDRLFAALKEIPFVTAMHYGEVAQSASGVPFEMPLEGLERACGVLVVEGYNDHLLESAIRSALSTFEPEMGVGRLTTYRLAFALDAQSAHAVPPFPMPEGTTR